MINIGRGDPEIVGPLIERMLISEFEGVRNVGGRLAAFAGLELGLDSLLTGTIASSDPAIRKGAAMVCARLLAWTSNREAAGAALLGFFNDEDEDVRSAAADVAVELRGKDFSPHVELLQALMVSPAFPKALTQLLFTLEGR